MSEVPRTAELNICFAEKERLWTVPFIMAMVVSFLINFSSIILVNLLPLFTVSRGGNNLLAGSLTTVLTFSAFFFRPTIGRLLDIKGRRLILILGLTVFAVASLALVAVDSIAGILVIRCFQGIGLAGFSTALGTIMSDIVPKHRISEGLGYFGLSQTIAMASGPVLGLYLYDWFGFKNTFIITFIIAAISVVCSFMINYEKKAIFIGKTSENRPRQIENATMPVVTGRPAFFERSAVRPCAVLFMIVLPISAIFSFIPLFAKARGIENISLFFPVYAGVMILARLFTGRIADRYGHRAVLVPALAVTVLMFLTLAFATSLNAVLVAAIFYGAGFGIVLPIMNSLVVKLSHPDRRGSSNATYYMFLDAGYGLGSFIWGGVSQYMGFETVFLLCAACVVLSAAAYFGILNKTLKEAEIW